MYPPLPRCFNCDLPVLGLTGHDLLCNPLLDALQLAPPDKCGLTHLKCLTASPWGKVWSEVFITMFGSAVPREEFVFNGLKHTAIHDVGRERQYRVIREDGKAWTILEDHVNFTHDDEDYAYSHSIVPLAYDFRKEASDFGNIS